MRGFSEEGMLEMLANMRKQAKRDLGVGDGPHYYTAARYLEALGQLEQVCRELGVDYGRCRSLVEGAPHAGKRRR